MECKRTAGLRHSAKQWSLAGDSQLLDVLQELHKKIVTNCQETNRKLDEMVSALDDASISLQNVNNRFMALSNTQFVESRVYDDDDDIPVMTDKTGDDLKNEPSSESKMRTEMSNLLEGIKVLESLHEKIPIVYDSDSGSDCEEEKAERYLMKLNDMYSDRPLPYVIGTQNWKESWHAGLLKEELHSDSASSIGSSVDSAVDVEWMRMLNENKRQSSPSTSSSSSEDPVDHSPTPPVKSQSDIAAEIAARLGGVQNKHQVTPSMVQNEKQVETKKTTSIYRPHLPTQATIYADEPPPLDTNYESDKDSYMNEEDDDIFAEINKNAPYAEKNKSQNTLGQTPVDIFAGLVNENVLANDFEPKTKVNKGANAIKVGGEVKSTVVEQKSTVKTCGESIDSSVDETNKNSADGILAEDKFGAKIPAGAISLFGTNKSNDSIGAAILRRNRPKSSSSDDADDIKDCVDDEKSNEQESSKMEKDIFENLFAKPSTSKVGKNIVNRDNKVANKEKSVKTDKKIDLFNDDIFNDDIDSLFAPKVKVADIANQNKIKSIFDDVDDLFADVNFESNKLVKGDDKPQITELDDDDLFAIDKTQVTNKNVDNFNKNSQCTKDEHSNKKQASVDKNKSSAKESSHDSLVKSNDSETNDNKLIHKNVDNANKYEEPSQKVISVTSQNIFGSDDDIFTSVSKSSNVKLVTNQPKGLFDDDDDDGDDLFSKIKSTPKADAVTSRNINEKVTDRSKSDEKSKDDVNNCNLSKVTPDYKIDNEKIENVNTNNERSDKNGNNSKKIDDTTPLFKEIDDDDLFKRKSAGEKINNNQNINNILKGTENKVPFTDDNTPRNDVRESSTSIFDDDDDDSDDLFAKQSVDINTSNTNNNLIKKEKPAKVYFDSDSDEDDLFGNKRSFNKPEEIIKKGVGNNLDNISVNMSDEKAVESEEKMPVSEKPQKGVEPESNHEYTASGEIENNFVQEPSSEDLVNKTINDKESQDIIENNKTSLDDSPKISTSQTSFAELSSNDTVVDTTNSSLFKHDIFGEVIKDTPPELETSKEKKKSKNVNALFDDDSDDESLFFKKNDNLIFDKPAEFDNNKKDQLFDIFRDEPPAIDSDLLQKDDFVSEDYLKTIKSETNPVLTSTLDKATDRTSEFASLNAISSLDNTAASTNDEPDEDFNSKTFEESEKMKEYIPKATGHVDKIDGITQSKEESQPKQIGKLKNINFNINVNTLLPGASPKKTVLKANEEKPSLEEKSEKLMKSISFDSDPDSLILDNTISKERPKIQVKRRPSTRRARIEAARKSTIDINDDLDVVDNANNTNKEPVDILENLNKDSDNTSFSDVSKETQAPVINYQDTTETNKSNYNNNKQSVDVLDKNNKVKVDSASSDELKVRQLPDTKTNKPTDSDNIKEKQDAATKEMKHVSTDNDKGSKANHKSLNPSASGTKILNINDDDIYIFNEPNIKTIGQVYGENKKKLQIFEDTDDLFKRNDESTKKDEDSAKIYDVSAKNDDDSKVLSSIEKKSSFLDYLSDDEQDLFGGNTDTKSKKSDSTNDYFKKKIEKPKVVVKKSLFDDDEDDDALFGAKVGHKGTTQKSSVKVTPTTSKEQTKSSEPIFDDPLSLFGDED